MANIENFLLAALPEKDLQRVSPQLEIIPLKVKELLHKPGERIDYVYFPGVGFCSIVTVLEDGSMVEAAAVGREGVVGLAAAALTETPSSIASMAQSDTTICYRMKAENFRREMERCGPFNSLVMRYSQALMGLVMQSAACNASHSIEQRLARWLLAARDRVDADEFLLTQEFIAMMLGASRSTVTEAAGELQKGGYITYHRGRVTILDRSALEASACECYRAGANLMKAVIDPTMTN